MPETHNNHFILHKSIHDKMSKIYIYQALLTFAKSLLGIFVPVYLYSIGYSFIEVILYSMGVSMIYLIMIPISVRIINKIGFKYTLLLSTPVYLLHVVFLNFIRSSDLFYHLGWISFGMYMSLFWPTFHSEIAVNGSRHSRSSQLGTLQVISTLVGTIAPMISGYILEFTSFWNLLILIFSLVLIGIVPLLNAKDIRLKKYKYGYSDYVRMLKDKRYVNSKRAFVYEGFDAMLMISVWPIIVFIIFSQNFFNFGFLLTIVALFNALVLFYTKSYFDRGDKNKFLKKIVRLTSINWFLKSLIGFASLLFLYIIEAISKLTYNFYVMVFMSIFYNNAKKVGHMEYIIMRELYLHSTKILFGAGIIILLMIFGESFINLCAIAVAGVFTSLGLSYMREEK